MICTCSGAGGFGAFDVPARDVYQARVNTVNAAEGINGHPVQLIFYDDGGNPATAVSDAQVLTFRRARNWNNQLGGCCSHPVHGMIGTISRPVDFSIHGDDRTRRLEV
jgi:hypothetical protein